MPRWSDFGEQVNRLVYTLAGCKHHGNIDAANRFVAERIHYSEASVRAMRQGRFRPRDDRALETLVEVGAAEAGLGSDWALRLLCQGQHPSPKMVLERYYPLASAEPAACRPEPRDWLDWFAWRVLGGSLGGLGALLIWSFAISRSYPAPHELPVLLEAAWGLLVGTGLAIGVAVTDWMVARRSAPIARFVPGYLALPLAGVVGALVWNLLLAPLFGSATLGRVNSTWLETLLYGVVYGLAFGAGTVLAQASGGRTQRPLNLMLFFAALPGALALMGFLAANAQPAFAHQKEVDLIVGVLLRLGLLLPVAAFFPPLTISRFTEERPVG